MSVPRYLTEVEALTKWCPMATAPFVTTMPGGPGGLDINLGAAGVNRTIGQCNCLASVCMVWVTQFADPTKGRCGLCNPRIVG